MVHNALIGINNKKWQGTNILRNLPRPMHMHGHPLGNMSVACVLYHNGSAHLRMATPMSNGIAFGYVMQKGAGSYGGDA